MLGMRSCDVIKLYDIHISALCNVLLSTCMCLYCLSCLVACLLVYLFFA